MHPERFSFARPEWLGEVDSTNSFMKREICAGRIASGRVVATHSQTAARGRMGNVWQSADGDLMFSFYWRGTVTPLVAGALPMACGLGVGDFLALPPWRLEVLSKWPNDVLVNGEKICGILTEGSVYPDGIMGLIVGIGVNMRDCPDRDRELGKQTASVEKLTGWRGTGAEQTLPRLLECLEGRIREWETGGMEAVVEAMEGRLWGRGRSVRARTAKGTVTGVVSGMGRDASLLLETDRGIISVSSVNALESGWE